MASDKSIQTPDEPEISAQLARITSSELFTRSRRLSGLLQYLVAESLAGRGDKIKAVTIAIEVFGRGEDFDQQGDPIVRVEAGRLRQRLADYYSGPGIADPLLIEIPKGGYRPRFQQRALPPDVGETAAGAGVDPGGSQSRNRLALGVIALLLFVIAILSYQVYVQRPAGAQAVGEFAVSHPAGKPFIALVPVAVTNRDEASTRLAVGVVEALITLLSKLSGLSVMAHASVLELQESGDAFGIADFRNDFGVTHLLRGTVEREGARVVFNVQLVDARTAAVIWAERMSRPLDRVIELEEELALAIVNELAVQLQPGERERLSQYHASNSEAWLLYRQGLVTIMPPSDLGRVQAARQLFQRGTEVDPQFAGSYAGLSFTYSTRALFMSAEQPAIELAQAIALAEKAISLDAEFAGGYAMLALAHVVGRDGELALENAQTALAIQPGDAFSRFVVGMSMVIAGRSQEAISHLEEALRLDPLEARMPYLNVAGIAYYATGDYSNALKTIEYNYEIGGPRGPHMDVFLAASHAQLGQMAAARGIAQSIQESYAGFPLKAWLSRWIPDDADWRQTVALLEESGLDLAETPE